MLSTEVNYYQSLYEVAVKVNSAGKAGGILRYIVKKVAHSMDAKGCSLLLLNPSRTRLRHVITYGLTDEYIRKGPLRADRSIGMALAGLAVEISDAAIDPRVQYNEEAEREGIKSILSVPVILREKVTGVMRVYTGIPHHFTDDDIFFVGAAANLGMIALENAMLYRALEHEYESFRHTMAEWQAALGNEWMAAEGVISFGDAGEDIQIPLGF